MHLQRCCALAIDISVSTGDYESLLDIAVPLSRTPTDLKL
jgi:hypothetical protein